MPLRALLVVAALAATAGPFDAPAGPSSPDGPTVRVVSETGHTLVIEYIDTRGPYRRARVRVQSAEGARASWAGRLVGIHIEGLQRLSVRDSTRFHRAGFSQTAEFLSSGHTTGSNIVAPAPDNLKRVWLRGSRGPAASFRVPTRSNNPSTEDDGKPSDTDGDDDDDSDDDNDDVETCEGGVDCVGLLNPWTCECEPEVRDPWSREPTTDGPTTQVAF